MAAIWPAGMVFVPSRDGRSHCEEEFTAIEDIEHGARTLLLAALDLAGRADAALLASRSAYSAGGSASPTTYGNTRGGASDRRSRATTGRWSDATRARRLLCTLNSSPSSSASQ